MKLLNRFALLTPIVFLSLASAQDAGPNAYEGEPIETTRIIIEPTFKSSYTFSYYPESGWLAFDCIDAQDNYDNPAKAKAAYKNEFGTDTSIICTIAAKGADIHFFPTEVSYVVDGSSYSVDYGEYRDIKGQSGEILEGTSITVALAFPSANRGEPFRISYEGIDTDINLKPWLGQR